MLMEGLVTRHDIRRPERPKVKNRVSAERLHELGLKGVAGMNRRAYSPEMAPLGTKRPDVYILGAYPKAVEDKADRPIWGEPWEMLRSHLPQDWKHVTRISNVVRTIPEGGKPPTFEQIECFRPSVIRDIEKSQPKAILGLGFLPLSWMLGTDVPMLSLCRGRRFPVRIGKHSCWYYPTYDPVLIAKLVEGRGLYEGVPGYEHERIFSRDIRTCYNDCDAIDPPVIDTEDVIYSGIETFVGGKDADVERIEEFFQEIIDRDEFFFTDLETTKVRPYGETKILSVSVAALDRTIAYADGHRQAQWKPEQLTRIHKAYRRLLLSKCPRGAHNSMFELEWLNYHYGENIMQHGAWHCTQAQAYVLDERAGDKQKKKSGCQGLDFLCQLKLGIKLKILSAVDRKNLAQEDITKVLPYNALDSKYGRKLYLAQKQEIEDNGQDATYKRQRQAMLPFVQAQVGGVPVDIQIVALSKNRLEKEAKAYKWEMEQTRAYKDYVKRYGSFDPASRLDQIQMFKDFLKRPEGLGELGKYTVDEDSLSAMTDEPLAVAMLKLRKVEKLRSTYIDPLTPTHKKPLVYSDGKIHPQYKLTWTRSGRSSCEDPNGQNYPKRTNPWIRQMFVPGMGNSLLALDYGALEACGIAMESRDEELVRFITEDNDIHLYWAEKIASAYPKIFKDRGGIMKKFRAEVKNEMVFPAFYLSSEQSIARSLSLPERIAHSLFEEFWDHLRGVKSWQNRLIREYQRNGFVEGLTGRRRHGPISRSMIVNSPVQGCCSDIVINAMYRMWKLSIELDKPWLAARLNIHDDLTFIVPTDKIEYALSVIVPTMCDVPFDFVNVPMKVEASVGKNWGEMKEIGVYRTEEMPKHYKYWQMN